MKPKRKAITAKSQLLEPVAAFLRCGESALAARLVRAQARVTVSSLRRRRERLSLLDDIGDKNARLF